MVCLSICLPVSVCLCLSICLYVCMHVPLSVVESVRMFWPVCLANCECMDVVHSIYIPWLSSRHGLPMKSLGVQPQGGNEFHDHEWTGVCMNR